MRKLTRLEKDWYRIEKLEELRSTLLMISNWMVLPLYLSFWICDIIYAPHLMWEFLGIRLSVIPACFILRYVTKKITKFESGEWVALSFSFGIASGINLMIFLLDDPNTAYYAGLNLVAIGSLSFIPWDKVFYFPAFLAIFGPYYAIQLFRVESFDDSKGFLTNSFFILSTAIIAFVIRTFNEKLRIKEYLSRVRLNDEIGNRDSIIIEKTDEGTRLNSLSRQFSPQVVEAIKNNKINISNTIKRVNICAIFIDIVSSTSVVVALEKEKVHDSISLFMDDTIKILLKYDITIDKFLGDGLLAFANEPVPHRDYIERVVLAAFEIRQKIASRAEFYEKNWISDFKIKTGIAIGNANVGFYGNEKYFRTYTAIGPVVNLASRLCSAAKPNQILISKEISELLDTNEFDMSSIEGVTLRGFSNTQVFEIQPHSSQKNLTNQETDCTVCNQGIMAIDVDENGLYILKCNSCGFIKSKNPVQKTIQKKIA